MAELDLDDIQRRMEASIASLQSEFMGLRAGRASTGMLEPILRLQLTMPQLLYTYLH